MVRKIKDYIDVSNPEALRLLEDIVTKYGLESQVVNITLDYLRRYSKVKPEDAQALIKELTEKYGLARITAIQVVNIMPSTVEELQSIISVEKRPFKDEDLREMINLLNSYRSRSG
ncbi:MAG: RNA polymerase Rpb4 family protein [Caldivirga sp.]|nr:RNA polymerase Rpb4 family protein [Caldivirga sp.]